MPRMKQVERTTGENDPLAAALPRGPLSNQLVLRNDFPQIQILRLPQMAVRNEQFYHAPRNRREGLANRGTFRCYTRRLTEL